jgi:hypothetical protein
MHDAEEVGNVVVKHIRNPRGVSVGAILRPSVGSPWVTQSPAFFETMIKSLLDCPLRYMLTRGRSDFCWNFLIWDRDGSAGTKKRWFRQQFQVVEGEIWDNSMKWVTTAARILLRDRSSMRWLAVGERSWRQL